MPSQRLWILKSKGTKSAFGGNSGYADELESHYVYDTTVKNHDKIKPGDFIVIADKKYIKGIATVEDISVVSNIPKKRYRCPECGTQEHYMRKSVSPRYKCRKKHEFDIPDEEDILVDEFKAVYTSTFVRSAPKTSVKLLDSYYINRNIYYSIQQAKVDILDDLYPDYIKTTASRPEIGTAVIKTPVSPYLPSVTDSREYKMLKSYIRPKQNKFRNELIKTYGAYCMLSDCTVPLAMEASHICPYRGIKDNHIANGILLRRDLHTLFDADLLGIEPETLQVFISPLLKHTVYEEYNGRFLTVSHGLRPSMEALAIRWSVFVESSQIAEISSC
ncbi:MAG TPA: HNH endonuclease signature motif containing protein [Mucilaginibacter sp.]|jgi:putative restriction endonuclease|nr:HNH endonuclease signature motif containing protein [Mucilaginibacter sp.]